MSPFRLWKADGSEAGPAEPGLLPVPVSAELAQQAPGRAPSGAGTGEGNADVPDIWPYGQERNENENEPVLLAEPAVRGTADPAGGVLATGTQWAAQQGSSLYRAACDRLLSHLNSPGTVAHAVWHYKPKSLAAHHEHAQGRAWAPENDRNGALGRRGEFTLHTIGRLLKIAGNGLSALGDSPVGIWSAGVLLIIAGLASWFLVFNPQ